ncbi:MAG: prephenate dehydrogenase [Atopobiaceae bacterium]|jgi:prephenate dehydrogenase|nr:prephenate dehydrogenase [Atopobiaceae bacterium]MCH4119205.1 prephenate dehydrogenase [Atopobiaceae bacterium]MCI1318796.1 prephenate dehydrogenase [Atopobiaceae bacterium]MCI1388535.1 prephenate dehydrogenase [Atopobiaceae bacterium]MCI1432034.1 prephenate dehydrogenase [Atopobiaceae bacterium]
MTQGKLEAKEVRPGRVGIVGLGLIGGSFAKAFHEAGHEVLAQNRTRSTLEFALVETVDEELTDDNLGTCELVIIATYPKAAIAWLEAHAGLIGEGAIVIDACGTKRMVCAECERVAQGRPWEFCGCHPMAGSQYSGFGYARADLFEGAPLVMCPPDMDDFERAAMLERLKGLLSCCGFGSATIATPETHDRLIAYTSQLPHVISNSYVKSPTNRERVGFSGGSYRDLTRVAHMNAPMWRELFLENADNLSDEIGSLIEGLRQVKDAIDARDGDRLEGLLAEGDSIQRAQEALR